MEAFGINNGSVLVKGHISWLWMNILFWRTFVTLTIHYLAIMYTGNLALKLGICEQRTIERRITVEEIDPRPDSDTATMYSFVKQVFYHKTMAYARYEKVKAERALK